MFKYFNYFGGLNLVSLVSSVFAGEDENIANDDDRGFGKVFKWRYVGQGFVEAEKKAKPIFLIIHRDTCPACQRLKEKFSSSTQLIELSNQFVMINVPSGSDVLSVDKKFHPDGNYVPRILFFSPRGEIISEAYNRQASDPNFRYFYANPGEIIDVMRVVLDHYKSINKL